MNETPPRARPRADAQRNRERVLAAARAHLDAAHLDAAEVDLPMNTIARTAGVGVATAYRHFPRRRLLLEALADTGLTALAVEISGVDPALDHGASVTAVVSGLVRGHADDAAVAAVLSDRQPESPRAQQLCANIDAAVGRVLARPEVAAALRTPVSPALVRALAVGVAAATAGIGRGRESELVATVVTGLLHRPSRSRTVRYADVPFDPPYHRMSPAR